MKNNKNKIKSLEIKGYKSISSDYPLTLNLDNINIFLGANGAGKSNIISFFKMLSFMMSGRFEEYVARAGSNQTYYKGRDYNLGKKRK